MIYHKHKIIFIPIPKNASASVVKYMKGRVYDYGHRSSIICRVEYKKYWDDYYKFYILRNPYDRVLSAYLLYTANPKLNDKTIQKKGPIDKYYYYFIKQFDSFEDFIINHLAHIELPKAPETGVDFEKQTAQGQGHLTSHFFPQINWVTNEDMTIDTSIHQFRFEDLDNVKKAIADRCNFTHKFPWGNKTIRKHYKLYYTDEMYDIVYKKYKQDFDAFGYDK